MGKSNRKITATMKNIKDYVYNVKRMGKSDLTKGMIRVIILCWLVPYLTLSVVLFYSAETKTAEQIEDTVRASIENVAEISKTKLLTAIDESKAATYDGVIKSSYTKFMSLGATEEAENEMYETVSNYLNSKYKYSDEISSTILLFNRKTSKEYYTYSNVAGATYASISDFKLNALPTVKAIARKLDTGTEFVMISGHLYLIRNIVTSEYVPFATLVMELNVDKVFNSVNNVVWRKDGLIFLDNNVVKGTAGMAQKDEIEFISNVRENIFFKEELKSNDIRSSYDNLNTTVYLSMEINNQKISFAVMLDKIGILNENITTIFAYVVIVILLIPLLFATFYYFYTNISKPISDLMSASEKIEEGEYGYKIEKFEMNEEFGRMIDTFNHMSISLEESFNRIYAEEVAVRDANMHALQSQINPHFLNNTLEIINWKARMSGNKDVSGMIESLGIMMEATMNRKNESFVTIKEELKYVDAYLYIIYQRFGSKFQFTKEIDETLLDIKIPRLIIQPLVENAVDHGGDVYGNKIGKLKIWEDEKYLHISVGNNGQLSETDKAKIDGLLSETELKSKAGNIGIRNVNLRLKLIYGEDSGLSIENIGDNLIVSEMILDKDKILESKKIFEDEKNLEGRQNTKNMKNSEYDKFEKQVDSN